jgi:hypothetical protein
MTFITLPRLDGALFHLAQKTSAIQPIGGKKAAVHAHVHLPRRTALRRDEPCAEPPPKRTGFTKTVG